MEHVWTCEANILVSMFSLAGPSAKSTRRTIKLPEDHGLLRLLFIQITIVYKTQMQLYAVEYAFRSTQTQIM